MNENCRIVLVRYKKEALNVVFTVSVKLTAHIRYLIERALVMQTLAYSGKFMSFLMTKISMR